MAGRGRQGPAATGARRIARLQAALARLGLYRGRRDGRAGRLTLAACDALHARLPAPPAAARDPRPERRVAAALALLERDAALQRRPGRG